MSQLVVSYRWQDWMTHLPPGLSCCLSMQSQVQEGQAGLWGLQLGPGLMSLLLEQVSGQVQVQVEKIDLPLSVGAAEWEMEGRWGCSSHQSSRGRVRHAQDTDTVPPRCLHSTPGHLYSTPRVSPQYPRPFVDLTEEQLLCVLCMCASVRVSGEVLGG